MMSTRAITQLPPLIFEEFKYQSFYFWHHLKGISQQPVLVNSSPKTGTTWMVNLIDSLPGYRRTGRFNWQQERYGDIKRFDALNNGDVLHGHDPYSEELAALLHLRNAKVILMMRDPRDQVVSNMFHIRREIYNPWHERLLSLSIDDALLTCLEGRSGSDSEPWLGGSVFWADFLKTWLDKYPQAVCIRYENLLADPVREFQKILGYLNINIPTSFARSIVDRNRFSRQTIGRKIWQPMRPSGQEDTTSHFRKGVAGDWRNYFKPQHVKRCKELLGETLIEMGYEKNFDWQV